MKRIAFTSKAMDLCGKYTYKIMISNAFSIFRSALVVTHIIPSELPTEDDGLTSDQEDYILRVGSSHR